jgi:2-succinyl-6-hydroxy-2,4-cyclohexadiene-1-carboxylate synthase
MSPAGTIDVKLALIHGFAGDSQAWDDVVVAGEVVRVELPGHRAPAVGSWDDALAAVHAQVAAVDVVIGYSLGARVALGLIATGRAPRAILIGCNPGLASAEERAARVASDAAWAALLRGRGIDAFAEAWEAQPLFATQARAPAARLAARRARRRSLDPEALARSLETMGLAAMPDYHDAIAAAAPRLHLIAGADDTRYVAIARELHARSTALGLDLIAESGHDPTLEQPEGLSRTIARALARLVTNA